MREGSWSYLIIPKPICIVAGVILVLGTIIGLWQQCELTLRIKTLPPICKNMDLQCLVGEVQGVNENHPAYVKFHIVPLLADGKTEDVLAYFTGEKRITQPGILHPIPPDNLPFDRKTFIFQKGKQYKYQIAARRDYLSETIYGEFMLFQP
ncbi:MAG TPA: hypothetical protein PKM84_03010 [Candidatus Pacearchaeota archaeon]|nr:hypothetical protein [Candidatus Pacearchaeota archaeon]